MKNIVKISFAFIVSCISIGLNAQDIHFTQFYASPLTQNPANTGRFNGDWRVMNNYRIQWNFPGAGYYTYKTLTLGYDQPIHLKNATIGVGGIVVSDQTEDIAGLNTMKIYVGGSYQMNIDGHKISIGLQPGYVQVSNGTYDFGDSYIRSTGHFDSESKSSGETIGTNKAKYLDINTGVTWSHKFGKITPVAGLALFHVNSPKETLFDKGDGRKALRKVFHAGGIYDINEQWFLYPNISFMHERKAREITFGSSLGMKLPKNKYQLKSVFAGPMLRSNIIQADILDAAAIIVGAKIQNLDIGISYDFNVSSLSSVSNGRGAWEFSIIYTAPSTLLQKITVPCERL
ncbi:MAG: type IX secretion system membrane protein PorP/SprF [Bacteroidetes bacterium]|nr:MAG: type IX secretion system membrane protein PorP/SprF [Bacteroidota bacterium]